MNNEIELGIGCLLYILYIVGINPHLVTLYKSKPFMDKSRNETMHKGVIKRGMEWPD